MAMNIAPDSAVASVYPVVPLKVTVSPGCSAVPGAGTMLTTLLIESCAATDGAAGSRWQATAESSSTNNAASLDVVMAPPLLDRSRRLEPLEIRVRGLPVDGRGGCHVALGHDFGY